MFAARQGFIGAKKSWVYYEKIQPNDGVAGDFFSVHTINSTGHRVAGIGNGSVYIFDYNGQKWTQTQKITLSTTAASVSMNGSGNRIVIGSYVYNSNQGIAYIYDYIAGSWTQTASMIGSVAAPGDSFGSSVAIDAAGTYVIVGSPNDAGLSGRIYVYLNNMSGWIEAFQSFSGSTLPGSQQFGSNVYMSKTNRVSAGFAPRAITNAEGAVTRFNSSGTITGIDQGTTFLEQLGRAMVHSYDGSKYVYGAPGTLYNGSQVGSIKMYDGVTAPITISPTDLPPNNSFGRTVAANNSLDTIIAGTLEDVNGSVNEGSVYVYQKSGSTWAFKQKLFTPERPTTRMYFSWKLCMNDVGDIAFVGASGPVLGEGPQIPGVTYVFRNL